MRPFQINKSVFAVLIFEVLLVIFSITLIYEGGDKANTGYLLLGATLTLVATFGADIWKRVQTSQELAHVLYIELVTISERCRFDFNNPWGRWISEDKELDIFRALKFSPTTPLIFESAGSKISVLNPEITTSLLKFYAALSAWRRDLENASDTAQHTGATKIRSDRVRTLAIRLGMTLTPAKEAVIEIRKMVPNFLLIDIDVLKNSDKDDQHITKDELISRLDIEIERFHTDIKKWNSKKNRLESLVL